MTLVQEQIVALEKKVGPQARSPLFAQLAALYLAEGRAKDALRVCDSGLAHHPFYTTGHLVKGKALLALNMPAEARRHFAFVVEWLPTNEAARALIASVPPSPEELPVAPAVQEPIVSTPKPEAAAAEPFTAPPYEAPLPVEFGSPVQEFSVPPQQETVEAIPSTEDFGAGFGVEPPATEAAPPPAPAETDGFGGLLGYTPEAAPGDIPAYQEPEIPSSASLFGTIDTPPRAEVIPAAELPPPSEDLFGFGPPPEAPPEIIAESEAPLPFGIFDLPQPSTFDQASSNEEPSLPVEDRFDGEILFSGPMDEVDTFDKFSLRIRAEISGENTLTLEEFFAGIAPKPVYSHPENEPRRDRIEELAERLQGVPKITPVINFAEKSSPTVSAQGTPASTGFVTPTLAEIYAKQGWYDDAIKAYRTLASTKPNDRERFERRIGELEEMKKKADA